MRLCMNLELNVLKNNIYIMFIYTWKKFNEDKIPFSEEGNFKKVYISDTNPNIVIKKFTEPNSIIKNYIERLTKEYPDLFAKIYKIDYIKKVIIQEKLNLKKVKQDLKELFIYLDNKNIFNDINDNYFIYPLYSVMELLKSFYGDYFICDKRYNEYSFEDINSIINDKKIKEIFIKWTNYLNKLVAIKDNRYLDVKVSNFGYDNKYNIKMFDI